MKTEIGEYIVGAYLKIEKQCDVVDYNVREPGGGMEGLDEFDVIGLDFQNRIAYLCEVTTHILGLVYGTTTSETIDKVLLKHEKQKKYAQKFLNDFNPQFMFWSPYVPEGKITEALSKVSSLDLVINKEYTDNIIYLKEWSSKNTHDTGNDFIRTLQILTHLRGENIFSNFES